MHKSIGVIKLPINRLHMELTNICNFSCEFCPDSMMKRQRGMLSVDMAKSILDEVSSAGITNLVVFHVMGEPTLHPNVVDLVEYANLRKVNVCITTNGSRLDLLMLKALQNAGVKKIMISLQTPDESTFSMRGAKGFSFIDYSEQITSVAKTFIREDRGAELTISFLSSPLRRLIIPVAKEFSIADTSMKLKKHLRLWAERILKGTNIEKRLPDVLKQINRARSFKENRIIITDRLFFHTRILGDWIKNSDKKLVKAKFGYCPGIQENFGILWNGDYVFCCTDYDGKTSIANFNQVSIINYLQNNIVQKTVRGFQRLKILDSYCQSCIGDTSHINSIVKQIGSVLYFKWLKRIQN